MRKNILKITIKFSNMNNIKFKAQACQILHKFYFQNKRKTLQLCVPEKKTREEISANKKDKTSKRNLQLVDAIFSNKIFL